MGWLQFLAGLFLWVILLFHVFTGFSASLLIESHQKLYRCRRYHFHKENALDLSLNLPYKTQCLEALWCLLCSIPLEFGGGAELTCSPQRCWILGPHPGSGCWDRSTRPRPPPPCSVTPSPPAPTYGREEKEVPALSEQPESAFCAWNSISLPSSSLCTKIHPI